MRKTLSKFDKIRVVFPDLSGNLFQNPFQAQESEKYYGDFRRWVTTLDAIFSNIELKNNIKITRKYVLKVGESDDSKI